MKELLYLRNELEVSRRDSSFVVRLHHELYRRPPDVNVWMVFQSLCDCRYVIHEPYPRHESLELERLRDEVLAVLPVV